MGNKEFIELVLPGARRAQSEHGICPSLTIAQAILESGWGQYAPGNNLFGIKWTEGCEYGFVTRSTREVINGETIYVDAKFRAYDTLADSIYDHAMFLVENSRYSNLLGVSNYVEACTLISQDKYATDPLYTASLIGIIEYNELYHYDIIETIIEEEEDMRDFTDEQKSRQAEFVVPDTNNVVPTGDNITPLNGGKGWVEVTEDGRVLNHISRCTYYGLSSDGTITLTHLGETRSL